MVIDAGIGGCMFALQTVYFFFSSEKTNPAEKSNHLRVLNFEKNI